MTREERLAALADLARVEGIQIIYNVPHSGGMFEAMTMHLLPDEALLLVEKGPDGPAYLLAERFGMTIDNAERWLRWAADGFPCRATTKAGRPCRNVAVDIGRVPMDQWLGDIHTRCRTHAMKPAGAPL